MMVARCHLGCLEIIHKRPTLRTLYRYIPAVLRYACKRYEVGITKGNTDHGIRYMGSWKMGDGGPHLYLRYQEPYVTYQTYHTYPIYPICTIYPT